MARKQEKDGSPLEVARHEQLGGGRQAAVSFGDSKVRRKQQAGSRKSLGVLKLMTVVSLGFGASRSIWLNYELQYLSCVICFMSGYLDFCL